MHPRTTVSILALCLAFFALATPAQAQEPGVTVDDSGAIVRGGQPGPADGISNQPAAVQSGGAGQLDLQPGPIPGVNGLLNSLDDLDRPLSPEEITAYGVTLQQQIPLSPELIRDYRRRLNESERAAAAPPTGQRPQALSKAIRVSLSAAGPTPQVYTSPGTVSVVSFFDETGAPWPVASFVIGRENEFQVYAMQEGSNQLAIAPLVTHALRANDDETSTTREFTLEGAGNVSTW
ncbi:DotH/IcmK family type IV secretion protein [Aurantimonas sp. C2-6-R+9]|uniref:DotH/IcmK family type IV secretion protein n=1 Tax=Aurantimonas sp. C2-6-R+9 TaxID=3114365 RepID=UPI002E19D2A1|nr:DotH/IcmK family type IV secretion protein [Aurantimonas sp. C2-6-R+9]